MDRPFGRPVDSAFLCLLFLKLFASPLQRVSGFVSGILGLVGYFVHSLFGVFSTLIDLIFHVISVHIYLVCFAVSVSTPCELTAFSPAEDTS